MSDRDKLIGMIKEGNGGYDFNSLERIADYLLSNGVIVPPCKVGDTVWLLQEKCAYSGDKNEPWNSCRQYWDNVCKNGMWGCAGKDGDGNIFPCKKKEMVWYAKEMEYSLSLYSPNIVRGENLFLTREEAEQAVSESEKKGR